jgi:hypothetical protein
MADKSKTSTPAAAKRPAFAINQKDILKQKQTIKSKRNSAHISKHHSDDAVAVADEVTKFGIDKSFVLFKMMLLFAKENKVKVVLRLQRSFHLWNRLCRGSRARLARRSSADMITVDTPTGTSSSVEAGLDDAGRGNWNQHQYLTLFTESEKIRDQLSELRVSSVADTRRLQLRGAGAVIATWLRSHDRKVLRTCYQKWHFFAISENRNHLMANQKLQLDVGMQRVMSEREVVKEAEETCVRLKSILICTLFFYKWRSCVAIAISEEERKRHLAERLLIRREILQLREAVEASNRHDQAVLQTATANGNQTVKTLFSLERNISAAIQTHQRNSVLVAKKVGFS